MKYSLAYKEGTDWVGLLYKPSKDYPHGQWGGIRRFDTQAEADEVLDQIRSTPNDHSCPVVSDEHLEEWKARIIVVTIPDEAVAKFEEVKRRIAWCDAHPKDGIPKGSTENSLFCQGREIGEISKEGHRILKAHLKEKFG